MSGAFCGEGSFSCFGILDVVECSCVGIDFAFQRVEAFGSKGVLSSEFVNWLCRLSVQTRLLGVCSYEFGPIKGLNFISMARFIHLSAR